MDGHDPDRVHAFGVDVGLWDLCCQALSQQLLPDLGGLAARELVLAGAVVELVGEKTAELEKAYESGAKPPNPFLTKLSNA